MQVRAIVSRSGPTDLVGKVLERLRVPILQVVGKLDLPTLCGNREVSKLLVCEPCLNIIPGATHLFEEPSTLQEVARLAE